MGLFFVNSIVITLLVTTTSLAWQPLIQQRIQRSNQFHRSKQTLIVHPFMETTRTTGLPHFSTTTTTQDQNADLSSKLPQVTLFNSKTKQKDVLVPVIPDQISMYTCGPTVYDYAHVGNFRAFLTYDLVKRVLEYYGYKVTHICNLTDVDDKIIKRANEQGLKDVTELTLKFEHLFMEDLQALNIRPATAYPRATEHIPEMMELILILRDRGLAYETSDGSWYFRTQAQPNYGTQLVQLNYDEMESTNRKTVDEEEKEHFADFCLWKAYKDGIDRDDAAWESNDIQKGRPGWHLECSAMARKFFGETTLDLHGGGVDLKFPHHENEIAQSEGAMGDGCTFCNCWFHNGFVNIGDEKMSKSLGNFLTLRKACPTGLDVRAYRYLVITSQYRNPLAFTEQAMDASRSAVKRIDKIRFQMEQAIKETEDEVVVAGVSSEIAEKEIPLAMANFEAALKDDISMPRAAAALFSIVKVAEQEFKRVAKDKELSSVPTADTTTTPSTTTTLDVVGLKAAYNAMNQMDQVFGIFYDVPLTKEEEEEEQKAKHGTNSNNGSVVVPEEVLQLVSKRTAAKEAQDWDLAERIVLRDML